MGATASLAEFVSKSRELAISDELARQTHFLILDSIGCALGGHSLEAGRISVAYAERQPGSSTIIGGSRKASPEAAIFANGQLINMLDFEEVLMNWGHHVPFVLPVALAIGEQLGVSGREVVRAVTVGYEVGARVSAALAGSVRAIESPTGLALESVPLFGYSANIFGSVATAAVLLGLNQAQVEYAFGIASYLAPVAGVTGFAAGTNIPMSKYGLLGSIAQGGYTAAVLAEMGFTSRTNVLDGIDGFAKRVGSIRFAADEMISGLGTEWWIPKISYKLYPSCRFVHVGMDNVASLMRDHAIEPEEIDRIAIKLWPQVAASPLFRAMDPQDPLDAQFNIPYALATTVYGRHTYPAFIAEETMANPEIRKMARKVEVLPEPRLVAARYERYGKEPVGPIDAVPCEVQVQTQRGTFTAYAETALGDSFDPQKRLSSEQLREKFRACANGLLAEDRVKRVEHLVMDLSSQPDLRELMGQLSRSN